MYMPKDKEIQHIYLCFLYQCHSDLNTEEATNTEHICYQIKTQTVSSLYTDNRDQSNLKETTKNRG